MITNCLVWFCKVYQLWISPAIGGSCCRHYPSCSEYAIWILKNSFWFYALMLIIYRIIRCNPFVSGGIDYPILWKYKWKCNTLCPHYSLQSKNKISFWLVPREKNICGLKSFYVLKTI